jgi:hypothetical protein
MFGRRRRLGRWMCPALVSVSLLSLAGLASAACTGGGPESVLSCYSAAHSEREIEALESLLAPDYVWVAVAPPRAELFDRESSVSASRNMFADSAVESVSLRFGDGHHLAEGHEANTWRIEDLASTLSIKHSSSEEPHVSSACVTLYVRAIPGSEPRYEIYREDTFEGIGCGE